LDGNNVFAGGETIVDGDGNDNQNNGPVDYWVFQKNADQGVAGAISSIPKPQISKDAELSNYFTFNKEVELVDENFLIVPNDSIGRGIDPGEDSLGDKVNDVLSPKERVDISNPQQERLKNSNSGDFIPVVLRPNKPN
jgi:hypothetical protein